MHAVNVKRFCALMILLYDAAVGLPYLVFQVGNDRIQG